MLLLHKVSLPNNHPFIDNKYTQWYYAIIERAIHRNNDGNYTERHHIIPDCLYLERHRDGVAGYLLGDSNDQNNLVDLTAEEHFICHWLLTKMLTGKAYYQMENALNGLRMYSNRHIRIWTAGKYARLRKSANISAKSKVWWTNGIEQIKSQEQPYEGWYKGTIRQQSNKIRNWFNNGNEEKLLKNCPDGWISGRLLNRLWYTNGIEEKYTSNGPDGWSRGRKPGAMVMNVIGGVGPTAGLQYYNNGTDQKMLTSCPDGYKKGRLRGGTLGLTVFNNGIINKKFKENPGDGWVPGYIKNPN